MKIKWLGHSSFLLTADSGASLITDPYDTAAYPDKLFYAPIDSRADVVTLSHHHADHGNLAAVAGEPQAVEGPGDHEAAGFRLHGVGAFHDEEGGALRGEVTIFCISADGLTVCHVGDLGQTLTAEQLAALGTVDVLLLPVGGTYTLDGAGATALWQRLQPALTIPMHFRNDKCRFPIDGVDKFLVGKPAVEVLAASELQLSREQLPASPKIVVLQPAD